MTKSEKSDYQDILDAQNKQIENEKALEQLDNIKDSKLTDEEYTAWLEYMTTQCYGCATQRHKCEHDGVDWEEYFGERDWSDDSIPNDWEIEGAANEK